MRKVTHELGPPVLGTAPDPPLAPPPLAPQPGFVVGPAHLRGLRKNGKDGGIGALLRGCIGSMRGRRGIEER